MSTASPPHHGRVQDGRAAIDGWQVRLPEDRKADNDQATVYVRPHDLDIFNLTDAGDALNAVVTQLATVVPHVRVDLKGADSGESIHADISRDRFLELRIRVGDRVSVRPRRHRLFDAV